MYSLSRLYQSELKKNMPGDPAVREELGKRVNQKLEVKDKSATGNNNKPITSPHKVPALYTWGMQASGDGESQFGKLASPDLLVQLSELSEELEKNLHLVASHVDLLLKQSSDHVHPGYHGTS